MPLTADRAKPAVPFAGHYRLVDFAISNLINSSLRQVVVLTQYKSHSLDRHVSQMWRLSGMLNAYVASVPAQQRLGKRWFAGSADAIFQSLNLIGDEKPDLVVVVGADHVYRMDFQQMIEAHLASGAGVTVAGIRQPREMSDQFGVITTDSQDPDKITAFTEKPKNPEGLPTPPTKCWRQWETTFSPPKRWWMLSAPTPKMWNLIMTWVATSSPRSWSVGKRMCMT